jgi:hypothetical protein
VNSNKHYIACCRSAEHLNFIKTKTNFTADQTGQEEEEEEEERV